MLGKLQFLCLLLFLVIGIGFHRLGWLAAAESLVLGDRPVDNQLLLLDEEKLRNVGLLYVCLKLVIQQGLKAISGCTYQFPAVGRGLRLSHVRLRQHVARCVGQTVDSVLNGELSLERQLHDTHHSCLVVVLRVVNGGRTDPRLDL